MSLRVLGGHAVLDIDLDSSWMAETIKCALEPETDSVPSERSTTHVRAEGSRLIIEVDADDLTALRAAMNSYLAWVSGSKRALESIENEP
jgi:KEOPS complex subunit Pcc1